MFEIMGYVEQNSDVLQSQKVQALHAPSVHHNFDRLTLKISLFIV